MRKKWTYVAVACMLLGTAPVFTGCIDTDEPAGLEDLRGAKSELLRAKAAVEAAKVAEVQAQAALLQAQAKVEEANAVKVQAEAEKIKAEAAIAQAKADYINAKTEQEKAIAQGIIDENNRIQAEWEAEAAVRQAEAEAAIKQAQLATAEALVKYQTVVAALQDTKNKALKPYVTALKDATDDYNAKVNALTAAQRNYNQQAATVEYNEAHKELLTRGLQKKVILKQKAYDGAVAALDRANTELKEAETLEPHALQVKYDAVIEEQNTIIKEIADLSVQAAEEAVKIYNEQIIPYNALVKEINELKAEPQEIAAVEFDFSGDGSGYPTYVQRGTFKYEESEYTFNDQTNLDARKAEMKWWINEFKSWTRDANDNAWTNDQIANWEGEIKAKEDVIKELKESWQEAINAYKLGAYEQVDPSKISGYSDVADDITAYNTVAAAYNDVQKSIATLIKQEEADYKAMIAVVGDDTTEGSAQKDYEKAESDINAKYDAMDPVAIYDEREAALKKEVTDATTARDAAQKALDALAGSTDIDAIETATATRDAAQRRLDAANTAYGNLISGGVAGITSEIAADRADELLEADNLRLGTIAAARKAYNDKWGATGTETAKLTAARNSVADALKKVVDAVDALKKSSDVYNKNLSEITPSPIDLNMLENLKSPTYNADLGYDVVKADLSTKIIGLNKDNLLYTIQIRSGLLYGQYFGSNPYNDWVAQVVELTDAQILAKVNEAMDELEANEIPVTLDAYIRACNNFGLAGERLALQEKVRIAKTWLNNADIVNAKIAQAEAAYKALTDGFDALEASIDAKEEEKELAFEKLQADLEETYAPVEAKRQEYLPLEGLLQAISHAISDYVAAGEKVWSEEGIKQYKANLQTQIQNLEMDVYDAQTKLMKAQNNLEKWNNDAITLLEWCADEVEDAQADVDRAKAYLEKVQAALDEVLAALTNDPTATVETPSTDTPATEE